MQKKINKFVRGSIHVIEYVIAILTLIVLAGLLILEVYKMFNQSDYFSDADTYLHNMLTIVVGLEFVRMLINLTPANTLEVLIVDISRHVILNHASSWSNIACVLCIGGLFAIRKFLVPKSEIKKELYESAEEKIYSET